MTNFEEKLANLRANLEAEKQAFRQERLAQNGWTRHRQALRLTRWIG